MYRNFTNKRKFQGGTLIGPQLPEPEYGPRTIRVGGFRSPNPGESAFDYTTAFNENSKERYSDFDVPEEMLTGMPVEEIDKNYFYDEASGQFLYTKPMLDANEDGISDFIQPTSVTNPGGTTTGGTEGTTTGGTEDPTLAGTNEQGEEKDTPSVTGAGSSATTNNKDGSIESLSSLTKVPLTEEERKKAQGILQGLQEKFPKVYGPRQKRLTRLLEDDNILMYPRMYNRKIGDRLKEPLNALRQQRRDKILQTLASPELGAVGQAMSMVTDLPERSFARAGYNMERGPKGKLRAIGNIAEGATSILGSMLSGFGPVGSSRGLRNLFSTDDGEEVTTSSGDTYRIVQQDDGSYEAVIVPQSELSTDRSEFFGEDGTLKEGYTRKYDEDGTADGFIYDSEGNRVYREMFINQVGGSIPAPRHQDVMTGSIFEPSLPTLDISTPFSLMPINDVDGDGIPDYLQPTSPSTVSLPSIMQPIGPQAFSTPDMAPVDKDGDGVPDTVDVDAGTGTDQPLEGVTPFSYQETTETGTKTGTETGTKTPEGDPSYLEMARRLGFLANVMQPNDITTAAAKTGMALFDTVSGGNPALGLGTAAAGLGKIGFASAREMKGARAEAIATADARRRAAERIRRGVMEGGDKGRQDIALENYLATGAYDPMATEFGQDGLMVGYSEGGLNVSNRGLLDYPDGVVVPSGNITMALDGLPSSVLAIPENDPITIMKNGNDYVFRNSNYVVEIPLNEALYG